MADRIISMRALLKKNLEDLGSKRDWSHITSQVGLIRNTNLQFLANSFQIGMFAYTGLTPAQMETLATEVSRSVTVPS